MQHDALRVPPLTPQLCVLVAGSTQADSVDSGPEHQLNVDRSALELLIGASEASRLWELPLVYRRWRRSTVDQACEAPTEAPDALHPTSAAEVDTEAATLQEAFIRRYSPEERPFIKFHADAYELTVNIALSDDAEHEGGRLIGLFRGQVQALLRGEGGATVHSSSLLHAVTRMSRGVRYSLILFFDRNARKGRRDYDPSRYDRRWGAQGQGQAPARWWE